MIGKLKGKIDYIAQDHCIVDVGGVGYILYCAPQTLAKLHMGAESSVYVYTNVREDDISLYGFLTMSEKNCFQSLLSVKGVGPKIAMVIAGSISAEKLNLAISSGDKSVFSAVQGVGPKLANRIIMELKDKIFAGVNFLVNEQLASAKESANNVASDAIAALISLGYNKSEAYSSVNKILAGAPDISVSEAIRLALKETT